MILFKGSSDPFPDFSGNTPFEISAFPSLLQIRVWTRHHQKAQLPPLFGPFFPRPTPRALIETAGHWAVLSRGPRPQPPPSRAHPEFFETFPECRPEPFGHHASIAVVPPTDHPTQPKKLQRLRHQQRRRDPPQSKIFLPCSPSSKTPFSKKICPHHKPCKDQKKAQAQPGLFATFKESAVIAWSN